MAQHFFFHYLLSVVNSQCTPFTGIGTFFDAIHLSFLRISSTFSSLHKHTHRSFSIMISILRMGFDQLKQTKAMFCHCYSSLMIDIFLRNWRTGLVKPEIHVKVTRRPQNIIFKSKAVTVPGLEAASIYRRSSPIALQVKLVSPTY